MAGRLHGYDFFLTCLWLILVLEHKYISTGDYTWWRKSNYLWTWPQKISVMNAFLLGTTGRICSRHCYKLTATTDKKSTKANKCQATKSWYLKAHHFSKPKGSTSRYLFIQHSSNTICVSSISEPFHHILFWPGYWKSPFLVVVCHFFLICLWHLMQKKWYFMSPTPSFLCYWCSASTTPAQLFLQAVFSRFKEKTWLLRP